HRRRGRAPLADLDRALGDHAVEGRAQRHLVELAPRELDLRRGAAEVRARGLAGGRVALRGAAEAVEPVLGDDALRREPLVALELALAALRRDAGALALGRGRLALALREVEARARDARVELEQDVARVDAIALVPGQRDDAAALLGRELGAPPRLH